MKFWILQTGEPIHTDNSNLRPMRAMNLSNKLISFGHEVVLWTSAYDHQNKRHRVKDYKVIQVKPGLEIRLIPSMGYKRHLGLKRLLDHFQLAFNLNKILKLETSKPDMVFIGYPPIESSYVLSRWARENEVPSILDVKDLWPSMFVDAFPLALKPLARIFFHPYFKYAKKTIKNVNALSAMAPSFLDWVLDFGGRQKTQSDKVFRLTSESRDLSSSDLEKCKKEWESFGVNENDNLIFFAGTFMSVFDFDKVIDSAKEIQELGMNCKFILCGSGDYLESLKLKASNLNNIVFPGWMEKKMLDALASMSIASLAPYKDINNYILNTPNKIVDSLRLGLPLLCPLSGEVENIIKTYNVGYKYGKDLSLTSAIMQLIDNPCKRTTMANNASNLYKADFEYHAVYDQMISFMEEFRND